MAMSRSRGVPLHGSATPRASATWSLFWRHSNLRYRAYDRLPPSPRIEHLLAEIDRDPTALTWALRVRDVDGRTLRAALVSRAGPAGR